MEGDIMAERYHEQHKDIIIDKYKEYIANMPSFVKSYFTFYEITKNASADTILSYAYDLDTFFYFLTQENPMIKAYNDITLELLDSLTMQDIQDYLSFLVKYSKNGIVYKNSEVGRARKLASLRSFYKYYQSVEKSIKNNPAGVIPMPKLKQKDVIALTRKEIQNLLDEVSNTNNFSKHQKAYTDKTHYRDMALITLLLGTGIRVSECVGINLTDIDKEEQSISIHRKGNKESRVFYGETVADALNTYIELDRKKQNIDEPALFLSLKGSRISVRSVERIVKKYSDAAITTKKITPHKLRSTYGTNLYGETGDALVVKDALGHSNISVVQKYVKADENARKEASKMADTWLNDI